MNIYKIKSIVWSAKENRSLLSDFDEAEQFVWLFEPADLWN